MTSMQFEGDGSYNGAPASFRVCIQQNGNGSRKAVADQLHVSCTAGCSYDADGAISGGSLAVTQQP
jgi:hypothetical protein